MGSIQPLLAHVHRTTKVLVIGGAYAGLAASLNLLDLCAGRTARFSTDPEAKPAPTISVQIKIVDERDGYYHLISSPLALASKEFMPKAWVKFNDIPALRASNISHVHGTVSSVDCQRKIAVISDSNTKKKYEESYDYLIAASGLRREWPTVPQSLRKDDYLREAGKHIENVNNAKEGVVFIGGGAVGVEMAAELKVISPTQKITLIHSRDKILSSEPLPDDFKDRSLSVSTDTGVKVILNDRVVEVTPVDSTGGVPLYELTLRDGRKMVTSHVIWAISHSTPSTSYLPATSLDTNNYVKILPTLNFDPSTPNSNHHFAIGDIASWSGIKRCGGAMFMGYNAAVNIHQQLLQQHFKTTPKFATIEEFPAMIALAIGKKAVVFDPQNGTAWGEEQMKIYFGEDLEWTICWNYLKLREGYEESG